MAVKIWAHRGASQRVAENTMAAFQLAISQGADGIELDVMRTADGVLVVTHDENCQRVTGQSGEIRRMSFSELRRLNFAAYRADNEPQLIPTLNDVLDLLAQTDLELNIELKNSLYFDPGLEDAVIQLVKTKKMNERVILSSFNHYSMQTAAQLALQSAPEIRCAILYSCEIVDVARYAVQIGVQAVHPLYANLQVPGFVHSCQAAGLAVNTWTVNTPDHIALVLQSGVDAIITDVPDLALSLRDQPNQAMNAGGIDYET